MEDKRSADKRDSAKSFSAALSDSEFLPCHSAPQICHYTLQRMVLCYFSLSPSLSTNLCEERGRCTLLSCVILAAVKVTLDFEVRPIHKKKNSISDK